MRQVWKYETSNGWQYGLFQGYSDHGGTDITYRFHRLGADGLPICFDNGGIRLDCVSGSRLKAAERVGATKEGEAYKI